MASQERPHSQPTRSRKSISHDFGQGQCDVKAYRFLLFLLAQNLYTFSRKHKDALGEIQGPARIKISREQQQSMTPQLDKLYFKLADKLVRDAIHRNSTIKISCQQFQSNYQSVYGVSNQTAYTTLQDHREHLPFKRSISRVLQRPLSSKPSSVNAMVEQAFTNVERKTDHLLKMRTIVNNYFPNTLNPEKTSVQQQNQPPDSIRTRGYQRDREKRSGRYQPSLNNDNFFFNGSEIVICEGRAKREVEQQKARRGQEQRMRREGSGHRRVLTMKMSHRKSIDEIERMQIQSRLSRVNTGLGVSVNQEQGYRPRSRCWLNL